VKNVIATVGVSSKLLEALSGSGVATESFSTLSLALGSFRLGECQVIVIEQPAGWSLTRIGQQVSAAGAEGKAIVLTDQGTTFSPGLYVLSNAISADSLLALVERVRKATPPITQIYGNPAHPNGNEHHA
jgi:hypothetical protein